jgi:hypothetical protein
LLQNAFVTVHKRPNCVPNNQLIERDTEIAAHVTLVVSIPKPKYSNEAQPIALETFQ